MVERGNAEVLEEARREAEVPADEQRELRHAELVQGVQRHVGGIGPHLLVRDAAFQELGHEPAQRQRVRHAAGGQVLEGLVGRGEGP